MLVYSSRGIGNCFVFYLLGGRRNILNVLLLVLISYSFWFILNLWIEIDFKFLNILLGSY